ncbi:MAG TPA: hypothetical protein VNO83_17180, partial [Pseudonocardia sp.]|nr:hypothetical protein [Pseudonocardia sp.]
GQVLLTFADGPDNPPDFLTVATELADGSFAVQGPRPWRIARAEYLPVFGLGQASTDWIPAR